MTIEETISKSIEGGFFPEAIEVMKHEGIGKYYRLNTIFLDPLFWQSLGKAMGWGQKLFKSGLCLHCGIEPKIQPPRESGCNHVHYPDACKLCSEKGRDWKENWHRFIDHLIEGKDAESFFETL